MMPTHSLPSNLNTEQSVGDRLEETEDEQVEGRGLNRQHVTINLLPDNVLLDVFDFYRLYRLGFPISKSPWRWRTLVHVCRRWRYIVLASPRRLDLRLLCTIKTPAKESLNIWPALPIEIRYCPDWYEDPIVPKECNNVQAALEHHDRVSQIKLVGRLKDPLKRWATVIQKPFPTLRHLEPWSHDDYTLVLPDGFLGGFAPRLQTISLHRVEFSTLPKLLSSTKDLVRLELNFVSLSYYISPEAMITGLSGLTKLESLTFQYLSFCHQRSEHPPSVTRVIIPALTELEFSGDSRYLEDLVAQIDAPLLTNLRISFTDEFLYTSQLLQFIDRTEELRPPDFARLNFKRWGGIEMTLGNSRCILTLSKSGFADLTVWPVMEICKQSLHLLSTVKRLRILDDGLGVEYDDFNWVEFCRPFAAVESVGVSSAVWELAGPALESLAWGMDKHVLPALNDVRMERS